MATQTKKYPVIHPSLYMRVNGKLQEMVVGDTISLDKDQATNMIKKGMVSDPAKVKHVEVDEAVEAEAKAKVPAPPSDLT